MTKLPVLDFHDIWLRSAVYIWYVFCDNMISGQRLEHIHLLN